MTPIVKEIVLVVDKYLDYTGINKEGITPVTTDLLQEGLLLSLCCYLYIRSHAMMQG